MKVDKIYITMENVFLVSQPIFSCAERIAVLVFDRDEGNMKREKEKESGMICLEVRSQRRVPSHCLSIFRSLFISFYFSLSLSNVDKQIGPKWFQKKYVYDSCRFQKNYYEKLETTLQCPFSPENTRIVCLYSKNHGWSHPLNFEFNFKKWVCLEHDNDRERV